MKTQGVPGDGSLYTVTSGLYTVTSGLYTVTSEDDKPKVVPPSLKGMIEACQKLEEDCLLVGVEDVLDYIEAGC